MPFIIILLENSLKNTTLSFVAIIWDNLLSQKLILTGRFKTFFITTTVAVLMGGKIHNLVKVCI